jgi:hypothetical protein
MGKKAREERALYPKNKGRTEVTPTVVESDADVVADRQPTTGTTADIDSLLDEMLEDSADTRVNATKKLIAHLKLHYVPETLEHSIATLRSAFMKSLKRGSADELRETLKCIQIVVISLGTRESARRQVSCDFL